MSHSNFQLSIFGNFSRHSNTYIFFLFTCLYSFVLTAQQNEHIWFLGGSEGVTTGIRFSAPDYTPTPYNNVRFPLGLQENNIILSNPNTGGIQFYSDGQRLVDATHAITPNGDNLAGTPSAMYGTTIVLNPTECDQYILFNQDDEYATPPRKVYYSIIDLELPGNGTPQIPLGDIAAGQKNIPLFTNNQDDVAEGLYALPKSPTSKESWLFVGMRNNNTLRVYDVSTSGTSLHQTYSLSSLFPGFPNADNLFGMRILFADGDDLTGRLIIAPARAIGGSELPIGYAEFNRNTGEIQINTMTVIANDTRWTYGIEMSPDKSKLYYTDYFNKTLHQYDFNTTTLTLIGTASHQNRSASILLAPNGEMMWVSRFNNTSGNNQIPTLSTIRSPNEAGLACNLEFDSYEIQGTPNPNLMGALPTFGALPAPPSITLLSSASCGLNNGSAEVSTGSGFSPFTIVWDNGETLTTAISLNEGLHTVTITDASGCSSELEINIPTEDQIAPPTIITESAPCLGDTIVLYTSAQNGIEYLWTLPNGDELDGPMLQIDGLTPSDAGQYLLSAYNDGCTTTSAPFLLEPDLSILELPDTTINCGNDLEITAPLLGLSYQWSNGNTTANTTLSESGPYALTVTSNQGCPFSDSSFLVLKEPPVIELDSFITVNECQQVSIAPTVSSNNVYEYLWTDDGSFPINCESCPSINFFPEQSGTLFLQTSSPDNGCVRIDSTIINLIPNYDIYIPNAFSPNFDGVNDGFTVFSKNGANEIAQMEIYSRWGELIFRKEGFPVNQPAQGWQGNFVRNTTQKTMKPGLYVYKIIVAFSNGTTTEYAGNIHLIR